MAATLIPSAGELLAAALVAVVVLTAAAALVALWMRRRWGRLRSLLARRLLRMARRRSGVAWRWVWSQPLPDRNWRSLWKLRRHLAASVAGAERSVKLAGASGAPTGDAAWLCGRLRAAAHDLDRGLQIAQRIGADASEAAELARRAEAVTSAAETLRRAALSSLVDFSSPAWAELAEALEREAAALHFGVRSVAPSLGPPQPAWPESFHHLPLGSR